MYLPKVFRWLPGMAVAAALCLGTDAGLGQLPASMTAALPPPPADPSASTDAPDASSYGGSLSQAPSAAPTPPPPAVQPQANPSALQPPPTPEQIGDSLMMHQRYQAAIEAYKKAPDTSADIWNKMGIAYQLMLNSEQASRCYQVSLRLNPKNPRVMNNLGTVYDSAMDYSSAERMYRKALKLDPRAAMFYKNLGTNLLAQHRYKKGWEMYQTALKIDPHVFEGGASPRVENPTKLEQRGAMNYYMARGCVRAGMSDCAISYLRMAFNEGFTNPKKIEADADFAVLRDVPAFQQLIAEQKQQP